MKILLLAPWPFIPAQSGGAERIYNLVSRLGEVSAYALAWGGEKLEKQLGHISYKVIPADDEAVDQATKLLGNGLHSMDTLPTHVNKKLNALRAEVEKLNPDLVILAHPWLIDFVGDRPFVYDAHNCETINTRNLFGSNNLDIDTVRFLEKQAIQQASLITYCSRGDKEMMDLLYPNNTPSLHIPNGCEKQINLANGFNSRNLIFIGSPYSPNVRAAQALIDLAPLLPEYHIQIVGGCTSTLTTRHDNVKLFGHVTDDQRDRLLREAHQFINLVDIGSGTHLKIARALSFALPVVTTEVGSRGYKNLHITNGHDAPAIIRNITTNYKAARFEALHESLNYDWDTIGARFKKAIHAVQ